MLDNGYGILFCQCGGKILYNESKLPQNYNIIFNFTDGSSLTDTMMLFTLGIYAVSHEDWQNRVQGNHIEYVQDIVFELVKIANTEYITF